jgi:alkanesulfonate monooxygenase SsuD/methylene tetrahydromethanopterin reductase-like flavin-dependent oxidoreductase (luciferase family)
MPNPPNVGFLIPQFGDIATPDTLRHIGALAEELGFESIWAADHLITPLSVRSPYPYNRSHSYGIVTAHPLAFVERLCVGGRARLTAESRNESTYG